jgi:hypothetical protein
LQANFQPKSGFFDTFPGIIPDQLCFGWGISAFLLVILKFVNEFPPADQTMKHFPSCLDLSLSTFGHSITKPYSSTSTMASFLQRLAPKDFCSQLKQVGSQAGRARQ